MRINIDGRFLQQDVTGVQRVAIELVDAWDAMLAAGQYPGLELVLLAPARGELVTEPEHKVIRFERRGRLVSHAWEQLELPRLARGGPLLCLGNLAPLPSLMGRSTPVHTMVHDLSYAYFPHAYSRGFRLLYNTVEPAVLARSRRVFTVSESERAAILQRYGRYIDPERLIAVQNGGGEGAAQARPSDDLTSLQPGRAEVPSRAMRDRRCLYVGSLTRRKNAEGLVRAAIEIVRTTDMDFVFVGSTAASYEATGTSIPADVARRIHFIGQVNDPERIEEEYRRASAFLFPSFYEASPLPPVEAMRFGCPVVAADIPSLRERCGDAVLYCDPRDERSLVGQVRRVIDDASLWDGLQSAGLQRAAQFSWEDQARTVLGAVLASAGAA
jgi:glycosyltransferase involved in cell wall biosynthesis